MMFLGCEDPPDKGGDKASGSQRTSRSSVVESPKPKDGELWRERVAQVLSNPAGKWGEFEALFAQVGEAEKFEMVVALIDGTSVDDFRKLWPQPAREQLVSDAIKSLKGRLSSDASIRALRKLSAITAEEKTAGSDLDKLFSEFSTYFGNPSIPRGHALKCSEIYSDPRLPLGGSPLDALMFDVVAKHDPAGAVQAGYTGSFDSDVVAKIESSIAVGFAIKSQSKGEEWIKNRLAGEAGGLEAVASVYVNRAVRINPMRVSGFVNQLPSGDVKDACIVELISYLYHGRDMDAASEWLGSVQNGELRLKLEAQYGLK